MTNRSLLFAVAFAACAASSPSLSLGVRVQVAGDSLRFTSTYQLLQDNAGAPDSARLTVAGTHQAVVKRLPPGLSGVDITVTDGSPVGMGYSGIVCLTVFRRAEKRQTCEPWTVTRADVPPPLPILRVQVDTL